MKRRSFLKGLFAAPVAAVTLPPIINSLPVRMATWNRPGHFACVYYFRKAFDLHASGLSREAAQTASRLECRAFEGVNQYTIWPPIPWEKYEFFHPRVQNA